ncbi:rhamnan synthesis F family protein [Salinibacterium sp. ZJ77]|uniref:rhamnan synthesis F family protein n=1 Tax=Salinibacterium sp. ZJ77 TaxID=2708337 RepID=UPI001420F4F2|nr:rhamnan synthesis F family protein [Salinibacterium sp. ZJ77]
MSRSLRELVTRLRAEDYATLVIRATDGPQGIDWPLADPEIAVAVRQNIGYDFGSWSSGLALLTDAAAADRLLLVNDSMIGPFDSLAPVLEHFEQSWAQAWGATGTLQFMPHLQSYFVGFKDGLLRNSGVERLFRNVKSLDSKNEIIDAYELGLSRALYREAIPYDAFISAGRVASVGKNPTINGWRGMLDLGFPMVKRQLVMTPELAPDGHEVGEYVAERYGTELDDWMDEEWLAAR